MQKNGSPKPQIETDDDRTTFLIRLPVHPKHTPPAEQDTDQDKPASGLGLPDPTDLDTVQATVQAGGMTEKTVLRLLEPLQHEPLSVIELLDKLSIKHRASFRTTYLVPALTQELIEMTLPDKPKSPNQKYRLTAKGRALLQRIKNPANPSTNTQNHEPRQTKILITGGTTGIGAALVAQLQNHGARVITCARHLPEQPLPGVITVAATLQFLPNAPPSSPG